MKYFFLWKKKNLQVLHLYRYLNYTFIANAVRSTYIEPIFQDLVYSLKNKKNTLQVCTY